MNKPAIVIISLFIALFFGIVSVWPKYQDLRFLHRKIEIEEAKISRREERTQELKKTVEKLKDYQNQLAKIDSALPYGPDLPALFDFLQKTSSQSGLILTSISYLAPTLSPDFEELKENEVSLTVSGPYESFKNFLSAFELTARLIETKSVSFSADPEKGPGEFKLTIRVYSY